MATSSIFTDFVIDKKEDAERFALALEKAEMQQEDSSSEYQIKEISDVEKIKEFFEVAAN